MSEKDFKPESLRLMMVVAVLAGFLASVSDVILLYSPQGNYHSGDYLFFDGIPVWRIKLGQWLGLISIPLGLLGYWWVSRAMRPAGKNIPFWMFVFSSFVLIPGIIYHSTLPFVANLVQMGEPGLAALDRLKFAFEPLAVIFVVGFLGLVLWMAILILCAKSYFPRKILWIHPLPVFLIIILLYLFVPSIGNVLIVAGFNLTIAIFLLACTVFLWGRAPDFLKKTA